MVLARRQRALLSAAGTWRISSGSFNSEHAMLSMPQHTFASGQRRLGVGYGRGHWCHGFIHLYNTDLASGVGSLQYERMFFTRKDRLRRQIPCLPAASCAPILLCTYQSVSLDLMKDLVSANFCAS